MRSTPSWACSTVSSATCAAAARRRTVRTRPGDNLFGNSIVAVDCKTGAYKWHFQSVRHDIFDMDNVHSPVLADVQVGGADQEGDLLRQQVVT